MFAQTGIWSGPRPRASRASFQRQTWRLFSEVLAERKDTLSFSAKIGGF